MLGLTRRLGLDPELALPAYEDPAYFLAKKDALPPNLDTADNKLDDPMERARAGQGVRARPRRRHGLRAADPALAGARPPALAQPALGDPARQAVPGARRFAGGLSPALGLPALGGARRARRRGADGSLRGARGPAGARRRCCRRGCRGDRRRRRDAARQQLGAVRTALAIEPRDGQLCIFMPPTESAEEFAELVAAIEDTAAEIDLPVLIEGYPPPRRPAPERDQGDARPRRDRGQHPSLPQLGGAGGDHRSALRGGAAVAPRHLQVPDRRAAGRHRRRQPCRHRRQVARGQPVPAPARPAGLPGHLLAEPPQPQLPVLRPVHRPDQPGAAAGRGARGPALRAGDRTQPGSRARRRALPALAGRPDLPQPADRRHRQHASGRDLHRQAVLARRPDRPAGPGRVPRLRDAAARAHEPGAAAASCAR